MGEEQVVLLKLLGEASEPTLVHVVEAVIERMRRASSIGNGAR